jgi:hypothetical protein
MVYAIAGKAYALPGRDEDKVALLRQGESTHSRAYELCLCRPLLAGLPNSRQKARCAPFGVRSYAANGGYAGFS